MAETTFYQKSAVNMDLLGLSAPHSLFESAVTATGTIQSLARAVERFGPAFTLRELFWRVPLKKVVRLSASRSA
jgi:hypothetical protein